MVNGLVLWRKKIVAANANPVLLAQRAATSFPVPLSARTVAPSRVLFQLTTANANARKDSLASCVMPWRNARISALMAVRRLVLFPLEPADANVLMDLLVRHASTPFPARTRALTAALKLGLWRRKIVAAVARAVSLAQLAAKSYRVRLHAQTAGLWLVACPAGTADANVVLDSLGRCAAALCHAQISVTTAAHKPGLCPKAIAVVCAKQALMETFVL
jgi:hypothetical protein